MCMIYRKKESHTNVYKFKNNENGFRIIIGFNFNVSITIDFSIDQNNRLKKKIVLCMYKYIHKQFDAFSMSQ